MVLCQPRPPLSATANLQRHQFCRHADWPQLVGSSRWLLEAPTAFVHDTNARAFIDSIRAPAKALVPIEGGGHFAVFMKSSAFLDQLVSRVLPLAAR